MAQFVEAQEAQELSEPLGCREYRRSGSDLQQSLPVLREHLLEVFVNERLTMRLICTPEHLTELVLGRLLTEGIISSLEEVELVYLCAHGNRARVMLKNARPPKEDFVEVTPSCCTGNRVLADFTQGPLSPVTPIPWEPAWIFHLAEAMQAGLPLHRETRGTHSCFLAQGPEILFFCEDIGRHNALDKVIGYALRHQIDLRQCLVYSSGRIPTDMVTKVIRSGIPILATKATPTQEAIRLAQAYGVTLLTSAHPDRFLQY